MKREKEKKGEKVRGRRKVHGEWVEEDEEV